MNIVRNPNEIKDSDALQEIDMLFEKVWAIYPRKKGKAIARRSFGHTIKTYGYEQFMRCVERYAKEKAGTDTKFVKHGDTFFTKGFIDYLDENYSPVENKEHTVKEKVLCTINGYSDYLNLMQVMPYKEYILTEHWTHFKEEALKYANHKCSLCNATGKELHVHHKTYENRGRETFNDIIVLCKDCHNLIHGKEVNNPVLMENYGT